MKGDEHLYVGSAKNILSRISDPEHGSFRTALCEADCVFVNMKKSEKYARDDEAREITRTLPRLNISGKSKIRAPHENL